MNTEKQKPVWWLSPYVVESTSISQYLLKGLAKILVGAYIASPMLSGDGWHNMADIFQAVMVVFSIWLARRKLKEYPYGLRNIESIISLLIGVGLAWTAYKFASQSLLGLLAQFPGLDASVRESVSFLPAHVPLRIEWRLFPWLIGLTSASVILSWITSWFQIKSGTLSGEGSLIADGKETRADSLIELAAMFGVLIEYLLGWRMIEYILGCIVAGFVTHTAWEILKPGFDQLVQRSLGIELEDKIRGQVMSICGVEDVKKLKTFRIGRGLAVVHVRIITRLSAEAQEMVRKAAKTRLTELLIEECEGIKKVEAYVSFKPPEADPHRAAYPARKCGDSYVIVSGADPDHILICDFFDGEAVKVEPYPKPGNLWHWLQQKHVRVFYSYDPSQDVAMDECLGIALKQTVSPHLKTNGLID